MPKRRSRITIRRCVISQKSADLKIYIFTLYDRHDDGTARAKHVGYMNKRFYECVCVLLVVYVVNIDHEAHGNRCIETRTDVVAFVGSRDCH